MITLTIYRAVFFINPHILVGRLESMAVLCNAIELESSLYCFQESSQTCRVGCHLYCTPSIRSNTSMALAVYNRHRLHRF